MHVGNDESHILSCFLHFVGGTEQQQHSFMEYTHVGVFQVS